MLLRNLNIYVLSFLMALLLVTHMTQHTWSTNILVVIN
jgi:hypothetical protein